MEIVLLPGSDFIESNFEKYQVRLEEQQRMTEGWTIEPETVLEKNRAAMAVGENRKKPRIESTPTQNLAGLKQTILAQPGLDST